MSHWPWLHYHLYYVYVNKFIYIYIYIVYSPKIIRKLTYPENQCLEDDSSPFEMLPFLRGTFVHFRSNLLLTYVETFRDLQTPPVTVGTVESFRSSMHSPWKVPWLGNRGGEEKSCAIIFSRRIILISIIIIMIMIIIIMIMIIIIIIIIIIMTKMYLKHFNTLEKTVTAPRSNNMSILPTTPGPAMARHLCSKAKQQFYPPPLEFPLKHLHLLKNKTFCQAKQGSLGFKV